MKKRNIFLCKEYQTFFDRNGYIVLPFVEPSDIDKLLISLKKNDINNRRFLGHQDNYQHKHDMHGTFWDTDKIYRNEIYDIITCFFSNAQKRYLESYKFVQANVFIKYPNSGYIAPHQNLTIVDENLYSSISFWCPSINTNDTNGGMFIVPGSHKKFVSHRAANLPWPLFDYFNNYDNDLWLKLNVKKGELLIIDDSIIHITSLNKSCDERWAFHAILIPEEATPFICEADSDKSTILVKKIPEGFLQQYMPGKDYSNLFTAKKLKIISKKYSEEEIRNFLTI